MPPHILLTAKAIYKSSVLTSQEIYYVTTTKSDGCSLFRGRVAVYSENQTEHGDARCGQNAKFQYVKASGSYSNRL
jgi:hypothetical protein